VQQTTVVQHGQQSSRHHMYSVQTFPGRPQVSLGGNFFSGRGWAGISRPHPQRRGIIPCRLMCGYHVAGEGEEGGGPK
jgi:hypothetical protein